MRNVMNTSNLTETEWDLRVDLVAAFHLAVANNLHEAIANHFSAVLPDGLHFLVNPFRVDRICETFGAELLLMFGNAHRGRPNYL